MSKHCAIMKRMKENYEDRQRHYLTRRVPVIIRIDGKAFQTYTQGLQKPFDDGLIEDMNQTAIYLCQQIQGAKCAYVQSDKISILVTDYDNVNTEAWFDYDLSKMESISASLATGKFNEVRIARYIDENYENGPTNLLDNLILDHTIACFDSRARNYPKEEVANYFLARQKDAVKNSIASVAQSLYSHKELEGKNQYEQQELIFQKGINWNDFDSGKKRGRFIVKNTYVNGELHEIKDNKIYHPEPYDRWIELTKWDIIRTKWEVVETPITFNHNHFTQWIN